MSINTPKSFADLRAFLAFLEARGQLLRVRAAVDPRLEITEICIRQLARGGPALLFENMVGAQMPVLGNLFGTEQRVAWAIGRTLPQLEALGTLLSELKQPEPPRGLREIRQLATRLARIRHMPVRRVRRPPCQERVWRGDAVDLTRLPIQTCWPGDVAPLITWPLVITQGADGGPINLGIYRMQLLGKNRLIMRWLKHRGGAQHLRQFRHPMPVAAAIGCDPGITLAAVSPIPDTLSEYAFAGLLREKSVETATALTVPLPVPARAEIVLEGTVDLNDRADEGPFGDHTGYYNEVESFPVFTVRCVTMRRNPLYHSTYTGRPPDEPAILALALNRIFVPLLRKQFPEIRDFNLPMEACSYRVAVVSLTKGYPGHAFRVMAGIWGFLRQFLYTKVILVVDAAVPVADWAAVMAAMGQNVHAGRDIQVLTNTPIDYLDFASPLPGLGGKMGIDATCKIGPEIQAAPPMATPTPDRRWIDAVCSTLPFIQTVYLLPGGHGAVAQVMGQAPGRGRRAAEAILKTAPPGSSADQLWVVDQDVDPQSMAGLLWSMATRFDPSRDLLLEKNSGRFALDTTTKSDAETGRRWGRILHMDEATRERVEQRWREYGF